MFTGNAPTVSRSDRGRWLGGVCVGLARVRGVRPWWVRAAFVGASLFAGLGVVAYCACCLILPAEDDAAGAGGVRTVALAQGCAVAVGLVVLGAAGAVATLFGFGWATLAVAAALLVLTVAFWPRLRLGSAWAVLPIAALTVPSLAVAADGLRLAPTIAPLRVTPRALAAHSTLTVNDGLGTTLIDLRHTELPASGTIVLRIHGGMRRTIVALPHARCVPVDVISTTRPFLAQVGAQLFGEQPISGTEVFGRVQRGGGFGSPPGASGPHLSVLFTSMGGSLYVRDYPDWVDPDVRPDWPGYRVYLESRPDTRGVPRRAAKRLLADWRVRRAAQQRSQRTVDALIPGPCGGPP